MSIRRAGMLARRPAARGATGGGFTPASIPGLALWMDGRTANAFFDTGGTTPATAPAGRVRRIDSPIGGQWLAVSDAVRPLRDLNGLHFDFGPNPLRIAQPVGVTIPMTTCTLAFAFRCESGAVSGFRFQDIAGGNDGGGTLGLTITTTLLVTHGGANWDSGLAIAMGDVLVGVVEFSAGGIALTLYVNGTLHTANFVGAIAGTLASLQLGATDAFTECQGTLSQFLGYNMPLSAPSKVALISFLQANAPGPVPKNATEIIIIGDSIGAGFGVTYPAPAWFDTMIQSFYGNAVPPRIWNTAVSGRLIADCVTAYPTEVKPLLQATGRTKQILVLVECSTNSMTDTAGLTAGQVTAALYAFCDTILTDGTAAGNTIKIGLFTCLPRTDAGAGAGFPAKWATVNTDLRANFGLHADVLVDWANQAGFGGGGITDANGANFNADHLHLSAAGSTGIAPYIEGQISALI